MPRQEASGFKMKDVSQGKGLQVTLLRQVSDRFLREPLPELVEYLAVHAEKWLITQFSRLHGSVSHHRSQS